MPNYYLNSTNALCIFIYQNICSCHIRLIIFIVSLNFCFIFLLCEYNVIYFTYFQLHTPPHAKRFTSTKLIARILVLIFNYENLYILLSILTGALCIVYQLISYLYFHILILYSSLFEIY